MAAAVLVDLALAGRLAYAGGMIVVVNAAPTGEPIADEILGRVVADTPHTPASWVQRLRHGLRDRVLADLCARGILHDVDETTLGFIHIHRYPTADGTVETELREPARPRPDQRRAAGRAHRGLAALVAAARMEPALYLSGDEVAAAHQRLEQISDAAGFTGAVSMEESSIRPSVALVVSVLVKASRPPRHRPHLTVTAAADPCPPPLSSMARCAT